jgi:uncharacterized protein YidB (DUF937 family)
MGLRDILTGMQNGPRGTPQPSSGGGSGGMSPIVIALLGLLAYKAYKGRGGPAADAGGSGQTARLPQGGTAQPGKEGGGLGDVLGGLFGGKPAAAPAGTTSGGGLGDILSGGLGGLLGGAAAGSVLSGGLGNLIKGFQESGHGHAAESWVGTGPNKEIAPGDLADALGSDTLDTLSQRTGMGQNELLEALRHQLPGFVDQLTPHGRIPTEEEASRMV